MTAEAPNYVTPAGYQRLVDELNHLARVARPKVCQEVSDAAAQGDRSENAEYLYGKKKLREIDRRMRFLQQRVDSAKVVEVKSQPGKADRVFFGATVDLEDEEGEEETVQLVGVDEIELAQRKISWRSPVGTALLGKREGDTVKVTTPKGIRRLTIAAVRYE
jgi:transcription elongation factor GreB